MNQTQDPRLHINEEPRNDFADIATGFTWMFVFMIVVFFGAVVLKAFIG